MNNDFQDLPHPTNYNDVLKVQRCPKHHRQYNDWMRSTNHNGYPKVRIQMD